MYHEEDEALVGGFYEEPSDNDVIKIDAIPDRAAKVSAATVSLLAGVDDEDAVARYRKILGRPPADIPEAIEMERVSTSSSLQDAYSSALVGIMGDATVPFEQKASAVEAVRSRQVNSFKDYTIEAAIQPDGTHEPEQSQTIREKLIVALEDTNDYVEDLQRIENTVVNTNQGVTQQVLEVLDHFIPGEAGFSAAKIASGLDEGTETTLASLLLPGTARRKLSEKFMSLSYDDRIALAQRLAPIVKQSSGLALSENNLRANAWFNDVTQGNVGAPEEFVDNLFNVLDLIGIGGTIKGVSKILTRGRRGISEEVLNPTPLVGAENAPTAPVVPQGAPSVIKEGDLATVGSPMARGDSGSITALEAERSELLGQTSGLLDKGQIAKLEEERKKVEQAIKNSPRLSPKQLSQPGVATEAVERRQNLQSQLTRIDGQIALNARASAANQRIAQIDKELVKQRSDWEKSLAPAQMNYVSELFRKTNLQSINGASNPRAPATILESVNPTKARSLHAQVFLSQTDEVAVAATGSTRREVLVKGVTPQITTPSGIVNKVADDKESLIRRVMADQLGVEVKNRAGGMAFSKRELDSARNAIKQNIYANVNGIDINDAMSSISYDGNRVHINAVYTNGEGGWLKPEKAIEQAKVALRNYGAKNDDLEILELRGTQMVPVKLEDVAGVDGSYAVRFKMDYDITARDIVDWDELDVKRNWLDRLEKYGDNRWGSLAAHALPRSSMLHPQITGAATVADDQKSRFASALAELFETRFSTPYMNLPKARRIAVDNYIREANIKEIPFNAAALRAEFSEAEVEVIRGWRDAWDQAYVLENYDVVKSLNNSGFTYFDHPNAQLIVKKQAKRYENKKVYDPQTDTVRTLTDAEIDQIYKLGNDAGIYSLRSSTELHGTNVEHIIVRNQGNEVARAFRDTDRILNYREGYYQVHYKNPQFITKKDVDGRWKVIGVTGSVKDAKRIAQDLQAQHPGEEFKFRGDKREIGQMTSDYLDMQESFGRLAQRHRGQLLESSVGTHNFHVGFIDNPADSAVRAAHSLGGRMAMRDTLDAMKERMLRQYADVLPKVDGQPVIPTNRGAIRDEGKVGSRQEADAMTTWEYVRFLENGYINSLDTTVKNSLNWMAEEAGLKGYGTVERMLAAGADHNITGSVKGTVFTAFLATNPLRQWLIQNLAATRMFGYNPQGMLDGSVFKMVYDYTHTRLFYPGQKEPTDFQAWFRDTGVEQGIIRGNLIRGTLLEAADRHSLAGQVHDATLGQIRKYGYENAEAFNLLVHGAAVYDSFRRAGRDLKDPLVRAEMHTELRAVTFNMNMADDMPYNQNPLALLFTYMQVPHKALATVTNRQLSPAKRARLFAADLTFWGLPITAVSAAVNVDLTPEDEKFRGLLEDGVFAYVMNGMASMLSGERQNVDFSGANPYGLESWFKMFESFVIDGGMGDVISNTPTSRVFGLDADTRIGAAIQMTRQFFRDMFDDDEGPDEVEFVDVANTLASFSSGWTNMQKARAAWMLGQVRDTRFGLTDDHTTKWEAVMMAFGFNPRDVATYYEVMTKKSNPDEQAKEDVDSFMRIVNMASRNGINETKAAAMFSQMMVSTIGHPDKQYHQKYMARLKEQMANPANRKTMEKLMEMTDWPNMHDEQWIIKNASHLTEEERNRFRQLLQQKFEILEGYRKMAEETN